MIRSLIFLCFSAAALCGQSWDELKGLKPDDSIRVTDSDGQSHKGAFVQLSDSAIIVRERSNEVSLERARVRRVEVKSGSRRVRNLLIWGGIGLAAGITIDQTLGKRLENEGHWDSGDRAISYAAPIGAFAALGALLPNYKTLYRVR